MASKFHSRERHMVGRRSWSRYREQADNLQGSVEKPFQSVGGIGLSCHLPFDGTGERTVLSHLLAPPLPLAGLPVPTLKSSLIFLLLDPPLPPPLTYAELCIPCYFRET